MQKFLDLLWDNASIITSAAIIVGCIYYFGFGRGQDSSKLANKGKETNATQNKTIKKKKANEEGLEGYTKMKILFASQTGTAEDFAHKLANEGKRYKFHATVVDMEDYDPSDLAEERLVLFACSTYGEGEPTDNSREFFEWLDQQNEPGMLSNLKYAIFGLGNKTYEHYNFMSKKLDKKLQELGAQRLYDRGEGDDDSSLEDDFAAWKKGLWPTLCAHFGITDIEATKSPLADRRFKVEYHTTKPYNAVNRHLSAKASNISSYDLKNPYIAKIVENRELHGPNSDRSCRHIEIELGKTLRYQVGDHLGVYAENDPQIVEESGKRLQVDLDTYFTMFNTEGSKIPHLGPCTIRQALTQWVDLTSIPRKSVLEVLAEYASDPKEKEKLKLLSDPEKPDYYTRWIKDDMRIILEVLYEFPSVNIPFDHFIEIMPRLAPRYYSISSSPKAHAGRVHITAVVIDFVTPTKRRHRGVCSSWLAKQIPTEGNYPTVPVFVRKSEFHLPKDHTTPIIMVGPGTGLAPFRGFIHERDMLVKSGTENTENVLFFGCRSRDVDFLYSNELTEFDQQGRIKLFTAFSRETQQKFYVQHRMRESMELLWTLLHQKKAHFYICGDARSMAKEVRDTLSLIIQQVGGKASTEAEEYLASLEKEGRYLTDVWF